MNVAPADGPITKIAQASLHERPFYAHASARRAMAAFLRALRVPDGQRVLLPAYIGWSAREGSGVFDPVKESEMAFGFYRLDPRLQIDLADLERELARGDVRLVVVIHYFGAPDPQWEAAVRLARRYGAIVLEDSAHAMLTDVIAGGCGREGDATFYSLHKLLPVADGGLLVFNPGSTVQPEARTEEHRAADAPWNFDLHTISELRVRNARLLHDLITTDVRLRGHVSPLWETFPARYVPQTYPVLIEQVSRDDLYFAMNDAGFGVVSLYHTMIDQLGRDEYPAAHSVARRILNLPVHQDVSPEQLRRLVEELARQVESRAEPRA